MREIERTSEFMKISISQPIGRTLSRLVVRCRNRPLPGSGTKIIHL
jgi:hypothetical protein